MCVSRLLISITLLLSALAASARGAGAAAIRIHVIDYAAVSGGILSQAQHVVERVFGTAGIRTVWREQASPPAVVEKDHVTVILLSDDMVKHKTAADPRDVAALGSAAPPPVSRAWIYFGRIENVAAQRGIGSGAILGQVIAHEVAHVVARLPHSRCGTMEAVLNLLATACQGFPAADRKRLEAALNEVPAASPAAVVARIDRRVIAPER